MPVVEGQEVLHQRGQNWDLLFGVVVHDLGSEDGLVDLGAVLADLLANEALVMRNQLALGDLSVVWVERAIELNVVAVDGVVGVIGDGVEVLGGRTGNALAGVGEVVGVAVRAGVDGVLQALELLTTEEVVKGAVFHHQDDHILDLRLEIVD